MGIIGRNNAMCNLLESPPADEQWEGRLAPGGNEWCGGCLGIVNWMDNRRRMPSPRGNL